MITPAKPIMGIDGARFQTGFGMSGKTIADTWAREASLDS